MPTYEYICTKCGHGMEVFQSMKAKPLKRCPACRKSTLKRQIGGGAGLIFKGTGFYITDYKSKPVDKSDSGAAKATSTPDSKPAVTTTAGK